MTDYSHQNPPTHHEPKQKLSDLESDSFPISRPVQEQIDDYREIWKRKGLRRVLHD